MKKPQFSIRTTLLVIMGILDLLIAALVGSDVYGSWVTLAQAKILTRESATVNLLYQADKYLSLERGASLSLPYVSADTASVLQSDIAADRKEAGDALQAGLTQIKGNARAADILPLAQEVEADLQKVQDLRRALDADMRRPMAERDATLPDRFFDASTILIMKIRDMALQYIHPLRTIDATIGRLMMFKNSVWEITEYAGREYAVIGRLIAEEKSVTPELQANLMAWRALIDHGWDTSRHLIAQTRLDTKLAPFINEAQAHYFETFGQIKDIFYAPVSASSDTPSLLSTEMWLVLSSDAVDSLLALKDASLQQTQIYLDQTEQQAERQIALNAFLFFCACFISFYCLFIIVRRVIYPINFMVDALYKTSRGLPHDPLPSFQRQDEIGKLASVLETFEDNVSTIKQSNEELERYAYITAHDLKSPLRAIDNLSQWIEEDIGDIITGETKRHMKTLRERVRRMEKLLNDTLEYSRVSRQADPANTEIINGKALIEDAVSMAALPAGFVTKIADTFSGLQLERMPLQQVFYNLINNAIKHHDKGAGTIDINAQETPDQYIFSVQDDGPGIPPQYHEKVFEMFQTLKPRDETEGSGMGLAIVSKILTSRGGAITLESSVGQGALFRFVWPKPDKGKKNVRMHHA